MEGFRKFCNDIKTKELRNTYVGILNGNDDYRRKVFYILLNSRFFLIGLLACVAALCTKCSGAIRCSCNFANWSFRTTCLNALFLSSKCITRDWRVWIGIEGVWSAAVAADVVSLSFCEKGNKMWFYNLLFILWMRVSLVYPYRK